MINLIKKYTSKIEKATLYQAWVSSNMVIPPITKIESNPIAGGIYKLYSESPNGVGIMNGQFKSLIENEALNYSWHWEGSEEHTDIRVLFKESSGGLGTTIIITHTGFQSEESKNMHSIGWDSYFEKLEEKILERQI